MLSIKIYCKKLLTTGKGYFKMGSKIEGKYATKINKSWPGATSPPRSCGLPSPAPGHFLKG
jgi:hypothetical protein